MDRPLLQQLDEAADRLADSFLAFGLPITQEAYRLQIRSAFLAGRASQREAGK